MTDRQDQPVCRASLIALRKFCGPILWPCGSWCSSTINQRDAASTAVAGHRTCEDSKSYAHPTSNTKPWNMFTAGPPVLAWGREEPPAEQLQKPKNQRNQQQQPQQYRRRSSSKHASTILKKRSSLDGESVVSPPSSMVSKMTDLYGHDIDRKAATASSATAAAVAAARKKAAAECSNSDDKARERLSRRAGATQERRRESSLRLNVSIVSHKSLNK